MVAVDRLALFQAAVGPHLDNLLAELVHSRGLNDPETLLNPLAQPLVQIPLWATEALPDLGAVPDAILGDLVEAAVVGYLHVRLQDDIVDRDATGDLTAAMFLSDALLIRHQILIARTVGTSPRFWDRFEALALGYGDAMMFERGLHDRGAYTEAAFARVLDRSMPLAIPALAVLDIGDGWEAADDLCAFVRHAVTAGQLVDDLRDVIDDVAAGRRTWVSVRLGGDRGRDAVLGSLAFGGFEDIVDHIDRAVAQAEAAAQGLGMTSAAAWIGARRAAVDALADSFAAALQLDLRPSPAESG